MLGQVSGIIFMDIVCVACVLSSYVLAQLYNKNKAENIKVRKILSFNYFQITICFTKITAFCENDK